MMPLAFTLLSIGFANVIRTQWVLPQGRDTIFVHSVLTGAVINLIANFVLIPPFGAMGAAAATVLAEFSVPAVQFVYLRKELPYAQYLKTTGVYCLFRAGDGGRGRSAWVRSPAARLGETRGSGNRRRGGVWRAVPDILEIGKAQRHFPPDAEKINPPFPS